MRAARKVIADAGHGKYFIHRVGHGIGLTTHEPPYMIEGEKRLMEPGMCFSIEVSSSGADQLDEPVLEGVAHKLCAR